MTARTNSDCLVSFSITRQSDNQPLDLTGVSLKMQLKNQHGAIPAFEASTANGYLVVLSPPSGQVILYIPFDIFKTLTPGLYYYDMVWVKSSDRQVMFHGTFPVDPGITDDGTPYFAP